MGDGEMGPFALWLNGWDDQSIWGWDSPTHTLFAQLTRNGSSDADGPDIWVNPRKPVLMPETLAKIIAAETGAELAAVHAAMNEGLPPGRHPLRLPDTPGELPPIPKTPEEENPYKGMGPYPLPLDGWEQHSVVGYGLGAGVYAIMRPDGTDEHLDFVIPDPKGRKILKMLDLAKEIAVYTDLPVAAIITAINAMVPKYKAPGDFLVEEAGE